MKIQTQLSKQFGEDLVIYCSNDEAMLFFTFKEQVEQAGGIMDGKPAASTMLILGGFKTLMSGMNLLLFVTQAQGSMNFILVAGCLIIEEIAKAQSVLETIDYSWIFSVYSNCKLPIPNFCLTEFNEGLYSALRNAWPKVLHGWSALSILRQGQLLLENELPEGQSEPREACRDLDKEALKQGLSRFVKNHTKTPYQFKTMLFELLAQARKWNDEKATSFVAYLNKVKEQKLKWARFALAWETDEFFNNQNLFFGDLILL